MPPRASGPRLQREAVAGPRGDDLGAKVGERHRHAVAAATGADVLVEQPRKHQAWVVGAAGEVRERLPWESGSLILQHPHASDPLRWQPFPPNSVAEGFDRAPCFQSCPGGPEVDRTMCCLGGGYLAPSQWAVVLPVCLSKAWRCAESRGLTPWHSVRVVRRLNGVATHRRRRGSR